MFPSSFGICEEYYAYRHSGSEPAGSALLGCSNPLFATSSNCLSVAHSNSIMPASVRYLAHISQHNEPAITLFYYVHGKYVPRYEFITKDEEQ